MTTPRFKTMPQILFMRMSDFGCIWLYVDDIHQLGKADVCMGYGHQP